MFLWLFMIFSWKEIGQKIRQKWPKTGQDGQNRSKLWNIFYVADHFFMIQNQFWKKCIRPFGQKKSPKWPKAGQKRPEIGQNHGNPMFFMSVWRFWEEKVFAPKKSKNRLSWAQNANLDQNREFLENHKFSQSGPYTIGMRVKMRIFFYVSEHFLWFHTMFEIFQFFFESPF